MNNFTIWELVLLCECAQGMLDLPWEYLSELCMWLFFSYIQAQPLRNVEIISHTIITRNLHLGLLDNFSEPYKKIMSHACVSKRTNS